MRRFWLLAAGLLLMPLVGCTHETTPDEAMQVMATGWANNKPQVAWEGLPPSYQKDVDGLIKDFAAKMDPEIWNGGFNIAKKVVKIAQEKKEYLLESPMLPLTGADPKVLNENWDDVVKAVAILVNSDLSEVDKLQKLNVNDFLSTTGADFMEHMSALAEVSNQESLKNSMADYKSAKFTLVKSEGDTATIKVEAPNQTPEPVEMVKVEGKWIPKELADNWDTKIKEAKESLAKLDMKELEKNKEPLLAQMKMIDTNLTLLLDSKSSDEFNGKLSTMAMMMTMGGGGAGGPPAGFGGGDFGTIPEGGDASGEDMPADDAAPADDAPVEGETPADGDAPAEDAPAEDGAEGEDPLFDKSEKKAAADESDSEAPAEATDTEAPEEGADSETPAEESEKDAPAEESESETPAEETKPE